MKNLQKYLLHQVGKAILQYQLIQEGDQILVATSGGKDSLSLLDLLHEEKRRAPVEFNLVAFHITLSKNDPAVERLLPFFIKQNYPFVIFYIDLEQIVSDQMPDHHNPCVLCSRLRRGILYTKAKALGFNKIALGHNMDDVLETLLLNLFFTGQLKTMPPKLRSDDGLNTVIRPLCLIEETLLAEYALQKKFPVITGNCPFLASGLTTQRDQMKRLIKELQQKYPRIKNHMLSAIHHVRPSHLFDPSIFPSEMSQSSR